MYSSSLSFLIPKHPHSPSRATTVMARRPHFLIVTFPAQGHINPGLQFAKHVVRAGATATFTTSVSARRRMSSEDNAAPEGVVFATFSDGYDDGFKRGTDDTGQYMSELKRCGSETLTAIIEDLAKAGNPVTCIVYTLLLPWAAKVAREHHLPSALLWIQPATVFAIYYYYFNGFGDDITNNPPANPIKLPKMPFEFTNRDFPSFLFDSANEFYKFILPAFQEQLDVLEEQTNPRILVNTFAEFEPEGLSAVERFNLIPVGPLIPSAFLDSNDTSDTEFGGDLFRGSSEPYLEWLDSQPESSVIYVSFGSISVLEKPQMEEIARALIDSGRPFLWVIRRKELEGGGTAAEEEELSCLVEMEGKGMVVPWCRQVAVLSHVAVGCFVTHCGWNSTVESVVAGLPVVAFPQWTDQPTNAKLLEERWGTAARVAAARQEDGVVEAAEIGRCLEMVMGEKGEEMRRNARKWRELARGAVREGGSSYLNLKAFVDEMGVEACEHKHKLKEGTRAGR